MREPLKFPTLEEIKDLRAVEAGTTYNDAELESLIRMYRFLRQNSIADGDKIHSSYYGMKLESLLAYKRNRIESNEWRLRDHNLDR